MGKITGANGPALLLRSVFAELSKHEDTQPLRLSRSLRKIEICRATGTRADGECASREEWFIPGSEPNDQVRPVSSHAPQLTLVQPVNGVQLAQDPRIPDSHERFMLRLPDNLPTRKVAWWINNELIGVTHDNDNAYPWPVSRGDHTVQAQIWTPTNQLITTPEVSFLVK